jgi:hypothetical protein
VTASETRDKPDAAVARPPASWDLRLDGVKKRFMARIARGIAEAPPRPQDQMKQGPATTADRPVLPTTRSNLSDPVVKARVQP